MFSTQRRIIIAIVIVLLLTITGVVASIGLPYESAQDLSGSTAHSPAQR
jgi:hypothetical protein